MAQRVEAGLTFADWCERADEKRRVELIGGRLLVSPSPSRWHQVVAGQIFEVLKRWAHEQRLGTVMIAPFGVRLDDSNVVEPDVIFMSRETIARLGDGWLTGPPDLAVEVLSPSTARFDRGRRRLLYARFGVREYWIVDVKAKSVQVSHLEDGVYTELGPVTGSGLVESRVIAGFRVEAKQFFADLEEWHEPR